MHTSPAALWHRFLQTGTAGMLLATAACSEQPVTASVAVPAIPAGEARVWFYRDDGPYESQVRPYLRVNDTVVGEMAPRGAFYQDMAPGHYHIAVDSYMRDANTSRDVNLVAGQQLYFKIVSLQGFYGGGGQSGDSDYSRPLFNIWLMPPMVAQAHVARSPFDGSR